MDWAKWHRGYESDPSLIARLTLVRSHISRCLLEVPTGPIQVIGVCAGDGRDIIGVLREHPRKIDVNARLVELNSELVEAGRQLAYAVGLKSQIEFVNSDATNSAAYRV